MDEAFYKEERARAQKISKGISGFGSQSILRRSPPRGDSRSLSDCDSMEHEEDSATLLLEDDVVATKRIFVDMPCSPASAQSDSSSDVSSVSKLLFPNIPVCFSSLQQTNQNLCGYIDRESM